MGDSVCVSCFFCWVVCTICGISDTVDDIKHDVRLLVKDMRPPLAQAMDTPLQAVVIDAEKCHTV